MLPQWTHSFEKYLLKDFQSKGETFRIKMVNRRDMAEFAAQQLDKLINEINTKNNDRVS